jgi:N utilization substance protein A
MENIALIESFSEFKDDKLIDRVTLMAILEDVFRSVLKKKYGEDDNFDIIVNLNQGDLEIWRFREVVDDDSEDIWEHDKISLTEAIKIEPNFNIGEEVAQPPVAQLSYLVAQPPVAQL